MTLTHTAKLTVPVSERDHIQGSLGAKATMLEYGDFECPYCGAAHPVVKAIQKQLGDQLCFAFRDFPLSTVHPHALQAAEAAEAAGAQGQFWQMHDLLFETQGALGFEDLLHKAQELGLDLVLFEEELQGHTQLDRVRDDFRSGVRSGVNGTPTFFINGFRHDGPFDAESLMESIRASIDEDRGRAQ